MRFHELAEATWTHVTNTITLEEMDEPQWCSEEPYRGYEHELYAIIASTWQAEVDGQPVFLVVDCLVQSAGTYSIRELHRWEVEVPWLNASEGPIWLVSDPVALTGEVEIDDEDQGETLEELLAMAKDGTGEDLEGAIERVVRAHACAHLPLRPRPIAVGGPDHPEAITVPRDCGPDWRVRVLEEFRHDPPGWSNGYAENWRILRVERGWVVTRTLNTRWVDDHDEHDAWFTRSNDAVAGILYDFANDLIADELLARAGIEEES